MRPANFLEFCSCIAKDRFEICGVGLGPVARTGLSPTGGVGELFFWCQSPLCRYGVGGVCFEI